MLHVHVGELNVCSCAAFANVGCCLRRQESRLNQQRVPPLDNTLEPAAHSAAQLRVSAKGVPSSCQLSELQLVPEECKHKHCWLLHNSYCKCAVPNTQLGSEKCLALAKQGQACCQLVASSCAVRQPGLQGQLVNKKVAGLLVPKQALLVLVILCC